MKPVTFDQDDVDALRATLRLPVIAIDPGSRSMGIAFKVAGELVSHQDEPRAVLSWAMGLLPFAVGPFLVVAERPSLPGKSQHAWRLPWSAGYAEGALEATCEIESIYLHPSTSRATLPGKPPRTRKELNDYIHDLMTREHPQHDLVTPRGAKRYDQANALAIFRAVHHIRRAIIAQGDK